MKCICFNFKSFLCDTIINQGDIKQDLYKFYKNKYLNINNILTYICSNIYIKSI